MRYTHKLDDVDARQVTPDSVYEIESWCGGVRVVEQDPLDSSKTYVALNVLTPDGYRRAQEGEYVVEERPGVFYVWKKRDFESTFKEA